MQDFDFREYVKAGFLTAVGKMPEYKIRLNSAGYFEKGVLEESDLAEIKTAIEKQHIVEETETQTETETETPLEEVQTEATETEQTEVQEETITESE